MPASDPKFSPYPFERLRRVSPRDAAIESAVARWIAARPLGARVAALVGPARVRVVGIVERALDRHAALAEVRIGGLSIVLAASARPIRAIAQRVLGGPAELDAPRPLTPAEHAMWALALAAAIADTGVAAEVWPLAEPPREPTFALELAAQLGETPMTVIAHCPHALVVRAPPPRAVPRWPLELPIVVARAAIPRASLRAVAPRDVIVVERCLELVIGAGAIGLAAAPGALEGTVATEYLRRDMALPDDAHLELTVQLGTTRLTLRQLAELAVGQIIPLGRPLAGPYEVRAGGRAIGHGELIDVDGEVGVRIVSIESIDRVDPMIESAPE